MNPSLIFVLRARVLLVVGGRATGEVLIRSI